ncbi:DUF58 domain-containing protein, partial [Paenarthrobacter aurescens]|nr:DUF58 domain-containing protein [Paenarthrobacter aurescens]
VDHRVTALAAGTASMFGGHDEDSDMVTNPNFEWMVTASMSITAHLAEWNYSQRVLDPFGRPAFIRSRSAQEPDPEEYAG